jgi:hypothetical protein
MERVWLTRLRWRMRGAWMWPVFGVLTLADAVLLHELPIAGEGTGFVPGALLAGFLNLIALAVLAPALGAGLRRRRPDLPRVVARDYAGTGLVVLVSAGLLAGGLAHRPKVRERERDLRAQAAAARAYVLQRAPAPFRGGLASADTLKLEEDLFRTCVPGRDERRAYCVFVRTDRDPPAVREDANREPNARFGAGGSYRDP